MKYLHTNHIEKIKSMNVITHKKHVNLCKVWSHSHVEPFLQLNDRHILQLAHLFSNDYTPYVDLPSLL